MMTVYLASPSNQMQADHLAGMPVLLSFTGCPAWLEGGYQQSFRRILIDSGAYSELNSGRTVDLVRYAAWAGRWAGHADAIAGLDDIGGNWQRSLANYAAFPAGFPTFHDTDPPGLLDELIPMARDRGGWIGLGLEPPRHGKEAWVRAACARIPPDLHVHGWALRAYTRVRRLDSVDSTHWWRRAMQLRSMPALAHLTMAECVEIVVKYYQRWGRSLVDPAAPPVGPDMSDAWGTGDDDDL